MSREEFATSLNTCLESMEELVALDRRKRRRVIRKRRPAVKPRVVAPPPVAPEPVQPETLPVVSSTSREHRFSTGARGTKTTHPSL